MSRPLVVVCAALATLGGGDSHGEAEHARERGDTASVSYWRDDQQVGGIMANLSVSISPTWPPSEWVQISYSGDECVIDSCFDFGGFLFCSCDYFTMRSFGGFGQIPASALEISPQGVAQLAFDPVEIVDGSSYGECDGMNLNLTPNGAWHWSENSQITVETPADVTRAVGRSDEWEVAVTGAACSLGLEPADGATGRVQRTDWTRILRTVKEE